MLDLLTIQDHEIPLGGTIGPSALSFCRAIWTKPIPGEDSAPDERIIHARVLQLHSPATLHRLGLRKHRGYHSCGSIVDRDWITALRVLVLQDSKWVEVVAKSDLPRPDGDDVLWLDLKQIRTTAAIIELRECGIDNWWPSWNLAAGGLILEGEVEQPVGPRDERLLDIGPINLHGLPPGVEAEHHQGELRYRSRFFDVGFCLDRAGFSHLGIDKYGNTDTATNMLKHGPGLFLQGPRLHVVGEAPTVAPTLRNAVEGSFRADGNRVTYDISMRGGDLRYTLTWIVREDRLELRVRRRNRKAIRAWSSSAWTLALDSTITPSHVIGQNTRAGETGLVTLPAWIDSPGHGSFRVETDGGTNAHPLLRSDAFRLQDRTEIEFRANEEALPDGDHLIPEGELETNFILQLANPEVSVAPETPSSVRRALERCTLTAFSYRPDTATLSNNGASMHCPICMDNWSDIARHTAPLLPGLTAMDLVRDSIERWLDGATGYASGNIVQGGVVHAAEDEYLMTGTASLLGLADYLEFAASDEWAKRFEGQIRLKIERMRKRDLDDDGLVESPYRTGVSNTGQWSTCWYDVLSFGWKDAISNALLYPALSRLTDLLKRRGVDIADLELEAWSNRLRESYRPAFFNDETGWLAGWRCKENELHDHALLTPSGVAVCAGLLDPEDAREIIQRLWDESRRVGMPDAYYGLPVSLWPIPDSDRADILQGYPFGFYQNGARTHSQSRHFVAAMYQVGMTAEADGLLDRLCAGLADGAAFGGCRSGKDWRYWDDRPCGYEGLLTDQFGILAVAMNRWGIQ